MRLSSQVAKLQSYLERRLSRLSSHRQCLHLERPIVSFTFDDFPVTSLRAGGEILEEFGAVGTYYISLDLLGRSSPVGRIASISDLREVAARGNELGCHTFTHSHAWNTSPREFEESVLDNRRALSQLLPGSAFRTHAYPIGSPRPGTKVRMAKYFGCCRGGGQTFNLGATDSMLLNAFFLEKSRGNLAEVKGLIEKNCWARGWLILATHDIDESPSNFGCTPSFFKEAVKYAVDSGAIILTVAEAWRTILSTNSTYPKKGAGDLVKKYCSTLST